MKRAVLTGLGTVLALSLAGHFVYAQATHGSLVHHGSHSSPHHQPEDRQGEHGGNPHGAHGDHTMTSHDVEEAVARAGFPTIGFEETHEVEIPFPTSDVMPLFEPAGRSLIYDWWEPVILREAEGETLKGLVTASSMQSHDIYLIVTEHEPEHGHIQYLVLWDDFELQRIDITCSEGETKGSTKMVWKERNAGLHNNGVSMVTKFVEGRHLKGVVDRYAKGVEDQLRSGESISTDATLRSRPSNQVAVLTVWAKAEAIDSTARFYEDTMGLRRVGTSTAPYIFDTDGTFLVIMEGHFEPPTQTDRRWPMFALTVSDLDESVQELREAKVELPWGIEEYGAPNPSSRYVMFRDPAGNLIEIVQWL